MGSDGPHHVSPAWIGRAATTLLVIPRLGFPGTAKIRAAADFGILFIAGVCTEAVLMTRVVGSSTLILPDQAAPLAVAMGPRVRRCAPWFGCRCRWRS